MDEIQQVGGRDVCNTGQDLVGSHGGRRHAGVDGSLNSAFLYFSLPVAAQAFQAVDTQLGPPGIGRLETTGKGDGTVENWAWFNNARFRVTLGIPARTLIGPALERVYASLWLPCRGFSSARTACTPIKLEKITRSVFCYPALKQVPKHCVTMS